MLLLLQQNCKSIGITISISTVPWAEFVSSIATVAPADAPPITMLAGSIPFPDPDTILSDFYYSPSWKSTQTYYNCSFYENDQVDTLIEQGRTAPESQRDAIYKQANDLIIADAASIWPIYNYTVFALRSNIGGFIPKPFYFTNVDQFRRNGWYRRAAPTSSPWALTPTSSPSTTTSTSSPSTNSTST
jgi:ABC-type transport system substrate-binding protein